MSTLAMNLTPPARSSRPEAPGPLVPVAVQRIALSVGAILVTLLLGRLAIQRFDAPVRELAITGGMRHVQADEVRAVAAPLLEAQLFDIDLDALRAAIERLPWVAHARVDRQWPARLAVRIREREPFARWGAHDALSTEGVVFPPGRDRLPKNLPQLAGAEGREREVMAMYGQLLDHLSETPFALAGLAQDARGEWTATTQGGVVLRFGRNNPVEQVPRLKGTVLPALSTRLDHIAGIDLRYANGFAVSWQQDAEEASRTSQSQMPDAAHAEPAKPGVKP